MASLTDQLSTEVGGIKPVRQAPSPSTGLATALNSLSKGIDVVDTALRQRQQSKRQAEEDAYKASERAKKEQEDRIPLLVKQTYDQAVEDTRPRDVPVSTTVTPMGTLSGNVFGNYDSPLTGPMAADTSRAISDLNNIQTAVNQKRMPGISLPSAINKRMSELMSKYPAHGDKILSVLRGAGIESSLWREGTDEVSQHESIRESGEKYEAERFEAGAALLLPEDLEKLPRSEVVRLGVRRANTEYNMDQATKQMELTIKQADLTEKQAQAAQDDLDDKIGAELVVDAYNIFAPIKTVLQQASDTILRDFPQSQHQKAFETLAPRFNQMAENFKSRQLAQARAAGYSDSKMASLTSQLDSMVDGVKDLWSGDFSVARANQQALSVVTTSLNLQTEEAMPIYFALKNMGMNPAEMLGGMSSLDPKLQTELRKEALGFKGEFGRVSASTRLANFVALVKGNKTLADMDDEEARRLMPSLYKASDKYVKEYVKGDNVPASTVLNSLGQVIVATRTITPGTASAASIMYAGAGTASNDVKKALKKALKDPEQNDFAEALVTGSRAASANILNAMKPPQVFTQFDDRFFKIAVDPKTGRAFVQKTGAKPRAISGGIGDYAESRGGEVGGATRYEAVPNKPPKLLQTWVDHYNMNVNNAAELNALDPNGIKNATPLEVARYVSLGIVPKALRDQKAIDPEKEIDKIFETVENVFEQVPSMNKPVEMSKGTSRGERNNNPGNIENGPYAKSQPGYAGTDGRFAKFDSPEAGAKAQENLLAKSYLDKGHNTPSKVIWRYGNDPGEGDDPAVRNYIKYVSNKLGIGPNDIIPREKVGQLARYMREFETGNTS